MDQSRQWFALMVTQEAAGTPTADQRAFLAEARELLVRLAPPRATPQVSSAVVLADGLHLMLPLDGVPHASLQLLVAADAIEGGWMDKHVVWDEQETAHWHGTDPAARVAALAWLESEMRRPFECRVFRLLGVPVRVEWAHADEHAHGWREGKFPGLVLAFLPGTRLASRTAAGFMDPTS